ncbi:putative spermidine/putrescine transport system substrate-binding protein [Amaricoccus macauensis]|uniref:Putative spermidine/putrescine transport system substrate-binding protein n=1 Tax=Amaricoccus macauensis TaxID=57001 RepID=A0A840SQB0_9RHOB|nr:extracellular solute-binding protein [Amaricoccus macauensis]MBB5222755.1 putative spermidine/putrescine transport system substrate-binding protein [Amaricoccus macauensis]
MTVSCFKKCLLAAASVFALAGTAHAGGEIVFGCFGGTVQQTYENYLIKDFESKHDIKVRYIPGVSTHFVAQLQAQAQKPEYDLVCIDNGPQGQARDLGVLRAVPETVVNYQDTLPIARGVDDSGVGYGLLAMGLVYNEEALTKAGVAPPRTWNDLADPRFEGMVGMPGFNSTPGVFTLMMLAQNNGGSVENIDPGFEKVRDVVKNVSAFGAGGEMSKEFQQGEIAVSVWTNGETARFVRRTGFPLKFVYPEDGTPIVMPMLNLVKDSPNQSNAETWLNYLLSEDAQAIYVEQSRVGPVNAKVKLTPELADGVIYGEETIGKLIRPDWPAINKERAAWTERWNREVER